MNLRIIGLIAVAVLSAGRVQAGSEGYVCTIAAFSRLAADGKLTSSPEDPIVGKEFTVDRQTGKIIGRYLSSSGFNTEVLDRGSELQSFKAVAKNPWGFLHVIYLEIQEFSEGLQKPFLLIHGSAVYSGRCV